MYAFSLSQDRIKLFWGPSINDIMGPWHWSNEACRIEVWGPKDQSIVSSKGVKYAAIDDVTDKISK